MKQSKTKINWKLVGKLTLRNVIPSFFVALIGSGIMLGGSLFISPSLPTAMANDAAGLIADTDVPLIGCIANNGSSVNFENQGIALYSFMDTYRYLGSTEIYRAVFGDSDYYPTLTDGEAINERTSFIETKAFQDVNYSETSQGNVKLVATAYEDHTWNCINVTDNSIVISDVYASALVNTLALSAPSDLLTKSFDVQFGYKQKDESIEMKTVATYQIVGIFATDDASYSGINYGKGITDVYGESVAVGSYTTIRQLPGLSLMFETRRGKKTSELAHAYKTLGTIVQKGKNSCTFAYTPDSDLRKTVMAKEEAFNTYFSKINAPLMWTAVIALDVICFAIFIRLSYEPIKALKAHFSPFIYMFVVFILTAVPYLLILLIGDLIKGIPLAGMSSFPILGDNQYATMFAAVVWLFVEAIYALFGVQKPEEPAIFTQFVRPSKEINIDILEI